MHGSECKETKALVVIGSPAPKTVLLQNTHAHGHRLPPRRKAGVGGELS
jgi:hypothetical protein